ncbi:MAG: EF-hand domain-containing protein [Burkholderiaceae bacterium]|nr:EF-hand domain-containing protein [Burkholderiaceae bacterium]
MMNKLCLMTMLAALTLMLPLTVTVMAAPAAWAQQGSAPCADPCLPQRLRQAPATPAAAGTALQQQAVAKLRQRFTEADQDANGALTRDEARQAGLGWLVNHFDQIDSAGSGKVRFEDMRQYIVKRRKQALGPAAPQ